MKGVPWLGAFPYAMLAPKPLFARPAFKSESQIKNLLARVGVRIEETENVLVAW